MTEQTQAQNTTLHHNWAEPLTLDITSAKHTVYITTLSMQLPRKPGATPHHNLITALIAAAARGVRVDVAFPRPSKAHPACAFNRHVAEALHATGVKVWFAPESNLLHAKTATIDERITWVGSGNWTAAAANHNHEAYLRAECPALARQQLRHWQKCGLMQQFKENQSWPK